MQVKLDTVKYAENVINATMNTSPNRDPNINYLLSIGLQFLIVFHGPKSPSEYRFIVIIIKLVNMMEDQLLIFRQINIQKLKNGSISQIIKISFVSE